MTTPYILDRLRFIMGLHEALHVKFIMTYGSHCQGLIVKPGSRIKKGEDVWWFDQNHNSPHVYTKEQIWNAPTNPMTFSEVNLTIGSSAKSASAFDNIVVPNPKRTLMTYSSMIDDDCFASTSCPKEDLLNYMNHSCEPNIGYCGDEKIIALRDIESGEQVLKDYAYTETQDSIHYGMACKCGSPNCRSSLDFLQYKDPIYIQTNYANCSSFIQRKMSEHSWLHDHVVRRLVFRSDGTPTDEYGLFAMNPIPEGTVVMIFAGKIVSGLHVSKLCEGDQQMSFQIDSDKWQIPYLVRFPHTSFGDGTAAQTFYETGSFINHSCEPNCGMEDSTRFVTTRDIGINEQITIDYAMVNNGVVELAGDVFTCYCDSRSCRGTITPQDYKIIELNIFKYLSPFVQEMCIKDMTGGITRNLTVGTFIFG